MRRVIVSLCPIVLVLAASVTYADAGKIHVCRAAGSTSTVKSITIPAGSSFTVGDVGHHTVKTTEDAKLGAKCASIEAASAADPEGQPIKQGKTPLTAQFSLPGVTLEGTVSRTFKPTTAAPAKAPASTGASAGQAASTKTSVAKSSPTASPSATTSSAAPAAGSSSKSGHAAPAPTTTDAAAPAGSTAKCKDGTYSKSQHHSGTCSHHGGVAAWLNP